MTHLRLLCLGLVIHLIFLISIFDIYFKSPIIAGITAEPNTLIPMGKRVVLISVDGLRVDSLFDEDPGTGKHVAEYILSIIKTQGTWGVSQSHIPTESRPGHVAMLAGFYEDPSAVTKGWKENPVDFDSVFNRSHCSFAWGSPDILKIFFKGLKHNCAFMEYYSDEQNFAGDTREYDNWVFEKLQDFLKFSKNSVSLYSEGIFFFLHLLGQDTSGHTDKPHTEKYRKNLQNVDALVEKIENLFYDFYGDDRTTFIFTSDHGMTDWGSHGAGDLEETNTPFVAWGAGIRKPTNPIKQININQADITPLLAVLLGSSIPVNSVGVLPISYLNMSKKQIAEAIFLNAKQIVAQYVKLLQNTEEHVISWFHFPFQGLTAQDISSKTWSINDAIKLEKYSEAVFMSKKMIQLGLDGLHYYHNYYQKMLLLCISLSYLAWVFYLLLELFSTNQTENHKNPLLSLTFCCIALVTIILIAVQKLPLSFYFYTLLPEILWFLTIKKTVLYMVPDEFNRNKFLYFVLLVMVGVEILVISFFFRWCLCISIGLILIWSLFSIDFRNEKCLMFFWLLSGCALGFFALLPIVGGQPKPLMTSLSGISLCFLSLVSAWYTHHERSFIFPLQILALILSIWNNYVVHSHFNENQELLGFNQHISWFLLVLSISLLLMCRASSFQQLFQLCASLSTPFLLLSVKHEGFFMIFFLIHLFCWINVENLAFNQNSAMAECRVAYFFLVYVCISFFGLGNITSLNSFDPAWVRCFITVFSPFLMSALILFKTIIPLLVATCTLRTMTNIVNIQPRRLFIIILIYCNIMGLNFLFFVRNKGSWLDIGTSISHYVIQQVTTVFLVLMFGIATFLIKDHSNYQKDDNPYEGRFNGPKGSHNRVLLPTSYSSKKQHNL